MSPTIKLRKYLLRVTAITLSLPGHIASSLFYDYERGNSKLWLFKQTPKQPMHYVGINHRKPGLLAPMGT